MVANAQILRNASVEIQRVMGSANAITNITNANPAVVTGNSTPSGTLVVIQGVEGMPRLNGRVFRAGTTGTSFELEGIDTTDTSLWGTYVSGGTTQTIGSVMTKFTNITNLSLPDATPDEIDITTVHGTERVIVFGHDAAQRGTFSTIADPLDAAVLEVAEASLANERRVFRVTLQSGYTAIFNAYVSGGTGLDGGVGAAGTAEISLTLRNKPQWFSS